MFYKELFFNENKPSSNTITDEEVWSYIAKKNIFGIEQKPCFQSPTIKKLETASLEEQIEYMKKRFRPLLPDKYEFIKREGWLSFDELRGNDKKLLYNPLWGQVNKYIYENFKPCSSTLIVQQCSNQKPYIDNTNYKNKNLKLFEEGYCDLVVNSICLVPIEFTIFYPFRHYDWNHNGASEDINKQLLNINLNNIIKFIDNFNYVKILLHGPYNNEFIFLYNQLKQHYGETKNIILIYDENMYKQLNDGTRSKAILSIRYSDFKLIKEKIEKELNYIPNHPLRAYRFGESIAKKFDGEFYLLNGKK